MRKLNENPIISVWDIDCTSTQGAPVKNGKYTCEYNNIQFDELITKLVSVAELHIFKRNVGTDVPITIQSLVSWTELTSCERKTTSSEEIHSDKDRDNGSFHLKADS